MTILIMLIAGLLVGGLIFWLRGRDMNLSWYEWLIGAVGLLLVIFTAINFFGSLAEEETTAATMFLLVFGLPGLILMVVSWLLASRRLKAS